MLTFASLLQEVQGNGPAREAMSLLATALSRRTSDEEGAFWQATDLYDVSRKAPRAALKADQATASAAELVS